MVPPAEPVPIEPGGSDGASPPEPRLPATIFRVSPGVTVRAVSYASPPPPPIPSVPLAASPPPPPPPMATTEIDVTPAGTTQYSVFVGFSPTKVTAL